MWLLLGYPGAMAKGFAQGHVKGWARSMSVVGYVERGREVRLALQIHPAAVLSTMTVEQAL